MTPRTNNDTPRPRTRSSASNTEHNSMIAAKTTDPLASPQDIVPDDSDTQCTILGVNVPNLQKRRRRKSSMDELNSSPIKRIHNDFAEKSPVRRLINSSPIKRKKSVAFSDDLISELPSTPPPLYGTNDTPKKSILKSNNLNVIANPADPNDVSIWSKDTLKSSYGPANPNFWIQGTIIQLPTNSPNLQRLVDGCISVLSEDNFTKRFEVYATLNNIYKSNFGDVMVKLLRITPMSITSSPARSRPAAIDHSNHIIQLTYIIKRDILKLEDEIFGGPGVSNNEKENGTPRNDPFRIRIINQALKLLNFFMLDVELNNFLPLDEVKWFYKHASQILSKPTLSKALVSPYLILIKDCKFSPKKKKVLFDTSELPETLLMSLLNMKSFSSSSIITEKFICFKNFVLNFPGIMAKNVQHWLGVLVLSICNLSSSFFAKCIGISVNTLLEVAKTYLDNLSVKQAMKSFLSEKVPKDLKLISSDVTADSDSSENSVTSTEPANQSNMGLLITKLQELIDYGNVKVATDIWFAITLLVGDNTNGFEKWTFLSDWLRIPKICFNLPNVQPKIHALNAWKSVVYNLCQNDLDSVKSLLSVAATKKPGSNPSTNTPDRSSINVTFKQKARLLTYVFSSHDLNQLPNEVLDGINNILLSILYMLLNPCSFKMNGKYLQTYWDKIVHPLVINFYFKRDTNSNSYLHNLGLRTLTHLLKNFMAVSERNFSNMRCLNNDPMNLNEINSLPARWVYSRFDKILHSVIIVFESEVLEIDQKISFFNTFLGSIKMITKKEVKSSDSTFDIIDSLPYVIKILFKHEKGGFDLAYRLVIMLNDTFDASELVTDCSPVRASSNANPDDNSAKKLSRPDNAYLEILKNTIHSFTPVQLKDLLSLIVVSLSTRKLLTFSYALLVEDSIPSDSRLNCESLIISMVTSRPIERGDNELAVYGLLCQKFDTNFEAFVKRLIQSVVSISNQDELIKNLNLLDLHLWKFPLFKYFLLLVQNAPSSVIRDYTFDLLQARWVQEIDVNFYDFSMFLLSNNFNTAVYKFLDQIVDKFKTLDESKNEFTEAWINHIKTRSIQPKEDEFVELDELLTSSYVDLNIDIKPFVHNNWDNLPKLKEEWLKNNDELYYEVDEKASEEKDRRVEDHEMEVVDTEEVVEVNNSSTYTENASKPTPSSSGTPRRRTRKSALEQLESEISENKESDKEEEELEESASPLGRSCRKAKPDTPKTKSKKKSTKKDKEPKPKTKEKESTKTPTKTNEQFEESTVPENSVSSVSESLVTKRKSPSKRSKTPKSAKKVSEKAQESPSSSLFDIHSFTAMLNAKLSSPITKEKRKKAKAKLASPEPVSESEVVEVVKESNVQVPSSFEEVDEISEVENDSLTQKPEPETIDNDSLDVIETSIKRIDYGKIMEDGFVGKKQMNGSGRLRKRTVEDDGSPRKKIRVEDVMQDVVEERVPEAPKKEKKGKKRDVNRRKTRSRKSLSPEVDEKPASPEVEIGDEVVDDSHVESSHVDSTEEPELTASEDSEISSLKEETKTTQGETDDSVVSSLDTFDSENMKAHSTAKPDGENSEIEVSNQEVIPDVDNSIDLPRTRGKRYRESKAIGNVTQKTEQNDEVVSSGESASIEESTQIKKDIEDGDAPTVFSWDVKGMAHWMTQLPDEDISNMTGKERFELETQLMKFILRMRSVGSADKELQFISPSNG